MNKKPTKTELLIKFIIKHWHHCPIDENIEVPACDCWGGALCESCIKRHINHLEGMNE